MNASRLFVTAIIAIPAGATAQARDTLRMRVAWEVSEGTHPVADSLGELSGIAVDAAGNVYVSDFSAKTVWVFAPDGRQLPRIGRDGRGPGEFEAPTGLGMTADGRLYVRDVARVTVFQRDPASGRPTRYQSSFTGPTNADWRSTLATRFDADNHLYYPEFNRIDRTERSGFYVRYGLDGRVVDTIVVPAFPGAPRATAHVRLNAGGGRMLFGLNHVPFAPLPAWDVTPRGTLLTGAGRTYELRETDPTGRVVQVYTRQVRADPIPRRERQDSLAALRARLDSVPVPLSQVLDMPPEVSALRLPTTFPPYMAAYAAADGLIWVRRWPVGTSGSIFDVFEPDGRLRTVVVLPRAIAVRPTPVLGLDGIAAVAIDRDTGANQVIRFVPDGGR